MKIESSAVSLAAGFAQTSSGQNDPVYGKLQIWTKDQNGNDELFAIGQLGIGAIYVNGIKSTYDLRDSANNTMGRIEQTGIFLREDGTAGTAQNVDMAV